MRVPSTRPPIGFRMWWNPYGLREGEQSPKDFDIVEVWNGWNYEQYTLAPASMHPATNVANLYWRPVREHGETIQ